MMDQQILATITKAALCKTLAGKAKILKENDSALLRGYLRLVLDPQHNFYVTLKGLPKPAVNGGEDMTYSDMLFLLSGLEQRIYTGGVANSAIAYFLGGAGAELKTLFNYAIDRKLPGNIGEKIVNKAFPGLIYHQPYGGCKSWDADAVNKRFNWDEGVFLQEKEDGLALFLAKQKDGVWHIHTRQGQDVTDTIGPVCRPVMRAMPFGYVQHVEARLLDHNREFIPRTEANGIFNSHFQGGETVERDRLVLIGLDLIEYNAFYAGLDKTPCTKRYENLLDITWFYAHERADNDPIWYAVACTEVQSLEKARAYVQNRWIAAGGEGGVLKDKYAPWKDTKMTSQMKMKNEFECSLRVVGWVPHKRNPEWVGSLICESSRNAQDYRMKMPYISTKVGSGLNEDLNSMLCRTEGPDAFLGNVIEVKAECISKNNALQHPRITMVRFDKTQADTYDEVVGAYNDSIAVTGG